MYEKIKIVWFDTFNDNEESPKKKKKIAVFLFFL